MLHRPPMNDYKRVEGVIELWLSKSEVETARVLGLTEFNYATRQLSMMDCCTLRKVGNAYIKTEIK